ncbi:DUF2797 domain-containing protein [Streptantibioticus silvisoli]|uniref:DUF2797 domain-containing protein n=1 Tax=Streptantibioticus silvisoli TaxID=2705255 RepID=A0ABT6VSU6_9ACTN|nr:DUF2797 domain-containing protein [Streptantibioticus silvisoli]MDI5961553.1 DUF2797 domain-containing protein [Streptantibioticus silvisoli]
MNPWRCEGPAWRDGRPALAWASRTGGDRVRPLAFGGPLAFRATGERRCAGVRRAGRRTWCPHDAEIPAGRTMARCPSCAALDRSSSVAADTALDDPRLFALYLAWFGPRLVKLGITAHVRGPARLLEQGALAHSWLGEGPLAAVRRAESALGAALDVPDRISARVKHAALAAGWDQARAAADLSAAHARATASPSWPDTVTPRALSVADHAPAYRVDPAGPPRPRAHVTALAPGAVVAGTLTAVVGPYAHLDRPGGPLLVDLRLLAGWPLTAAAPDSAVTAPSRPLPAAPEPPPDGLF